MTSVQKNGSSVEISLVIPCYNEERRIGDTLNDCLEYFEREVLAAEIIVVDDGSEDATAATIRDGFPNVRLVTCPENRGKGHAVKIGMLEARGQHRLFYDADGSTPISELEKVWPLFEDGADIVIGSRALAASDIAVRQPWYRQNMGRTYNLLLRMLRLTTFPDTQCGFKVMTAESAEALFPMITRDGYGMDCELLNLALRSGFRVEQVPVRWLNSLDSRVRIIRDSLDMVREVLLIRWALTTGQYGKLGERDVSR